jgi:bifunctional UDP-N-acetylglucosamine pyrophosphorylase/glucosamine-1-phosphate N-acetyltransferase
MTGEKPLVVVIMAAGVGKRMKWDGPKALAPLCGRPMLSYVLETARALSPARIVIVAGHKREMIMSAFAAPDVAFAIQEPQMGTAHAVSCAREALTGFSGDVAVLSADVPLIKPSTLRGMIDKKEKFGAAIAVLTIVLEQPGSYGRMVRDGERIVATVEARDATAEQLKIREINSGVYVFDSEFLFRALDEVKNDNAQGEYYLTDLIAMAVNEGRMVVGVAADDEMEALGANTLEDLERLQLAIPISPPKL